MNSLHEMPVFVVVVEKGSFSGAASQLGITKSAVSKRINHLECRLGVRLLHRTTRKLSLTEAGERYYHHAVRAVAAARDAEDEVSQLQGAPRGRLRISTPMSFGRLYLAPLIPEFLKRYPDLRLEMVMDDRLTNLVEEGIDVAIRGGSLTDSSLIARKLVPFRSMVCATPTYLDNHGRPEHPRQLTHHNCLIYAYSSESDRWTFQSESGSETVEVAGNYRVNNSEALLEAILQGLGIGRLPGFVGAPSVVSGRLEQLFPNNPMPERALYAVFPRREYLPAKVKTFLDFISQALNNFEW